MNLSKPTQKKATKLLRLLEEARKLALEIRTEARGDRNYPAAGTAGHIAEALLQVNEDGDDEGLITSARALAERQ